MNQSASHILIVDDQYANRFLIAEMLEGYKISMASSGKEMWIEIAKQTPNLILLDVMMPEEDGFSLAKKLQEHPEYKAIPIIFVTAKVSGDDIDEGFNSGGFDYIKKPFNQQELETRVKKALDSSAKTHELLTRAITGDMIFETMLESLILTDKDFRIISINPACSEISGYSIQDVDTLFFPDLICDETQNPIAIGKLLHKKHEVFLITKSKKIIPISLSISLVKDENDFELGWVCLFHDISERKIMEQNLIIAKDNAEQSDKMKSMFLANMSHEIRTPLNSIIGFSDLLEDEDNTQSERIKYIQIIRKNGEKLLAFIDNLLDISSIETQKIHITKNTCKPSDILNDLYDEFIAIQKKHRKEAISFKVINQLPEDFYIISDEKRMYQCIYNILDNAFKYTVEGEIICKCRLKEIGGNEIEFIVQDTGIGISPEGEAKIFKSFQKLENNKLDNTGGLGLGLAISRNIAKMLGGTITLKSKIDEGSIFTIIFPVS